MEGEEGGVIAARPHGSLHLVLAKRGSKSIKVHCASVAAVRRGIKCVL